MLVSVGKEGGGWGGERVWSVGGGMGKRERDAKERVAGIMGIYDHTTTEFKSFGAQSAKYRQRGASRFSLWN